MTVSLSLSPPLKTTSIDASVHPISLIRTHQLHFQVQSPTLIN